MTSTAAAPPRWDMTPFFPGLDSPEFDAAVDAFAQQIAELEALWNEHGVDGQAPAANAPLDAWETVFERYNAALEASRLLFGYVSSFTSTDSRDAAAQARMSELQQLGARLGKLGIRWTAWIGSLDVDGLLAGSALAREHDYALRRAQQRAEHQMPPAEEALAADLELSSGTAWSKLHGNLCSQLLVPFARDRELEQLPMSVLRNLAYEPDRELRRRAYEAELEAWERAALPLAAALNSIKGEVNTLAARRSWPSPLDAALWENSIDRRTLDAMLDSAREAFPDFRRYLKAKARALGVERAAWYDIFAPVGSATQSWSYEQAEYFVVEQFGTYSPRLAEFAGRAFDGQWIDAEPRPGKRDGAFCMGLRGDESRVFSNFKPSFGGVSTLAHELGHAYHNLTLGSRTALQRSYPMTLAETASIFCETIVQHAALAAAGESEQLAIVEASLQRSTQTVVDISSRFLFEQRLFEARTRRELSVDELCSLMLDAQRETYGDGLDETTLHPYMWAVKPHYYNVGRSFYNYPYMFGLLFGLGLYARYQADPESFRDGYDDLLASAGMADAASLAGRFGIDIRTPDFWRASLDIVRADVDRFEALVDARTN